MPENEILIGYIKGETGSGLKVLDYFDTLEALTSAITNPSPGDAYGVGTAAPYQIYIYSANKGWVNNGALQPDINEQTPIYTETEFAPLTSGEKISVAFGKISKAIKQIMYHAGNMQNPHQTTLKQVGAAPEGHGLGSVASGTYNDSFNGIFNKGCGFYQIKKAEESPDGSGRWFPVVQISRGNVEDQELGAQMAFLDESGSENIKMWMRTASLGVFSDWVEMLHTGNIDNYRHKVVTGTYTGDSTAPRKISLEFTPDVVLVFGKSGMVSFLTPQNGYRGCGGMALKGFPCKVANVATIEIVDGGFNVAYVAPNGDATAHVPMTNESGTQYYYMAIRNPIK